jgi:cytochrome c oxidase cbb3-type subunit 2
VASPQVRVLALVAALLPPLVSAGADLAERTPPHLLARGREVFERHCTVCHGPRGDGRGELAPVTLPRPRDFTRGLFKYRSTSTGSLPTDDDLEQTIRSGLTGTAMPAFIDLRDDEIRAVVRFVKSLAPRRAATAAPPRPLDLPAVPAWFHDEDAAAERSLQGRSLFRQACAPCHGERGDGQGSSALSLRDAWDEPCPPRNLRDDGLRRGTAPEAIFLTLVTGLDGTPMPSFAAALDAEETWSVVAFLVELRGRGGERPGSRR